MRGAVGMSTLIRRLRCLCLIALAATGLVATSAAAAIPRQAGSFHYTATRPATSTGFVISFEFQNPAGANLKPPAVKSMVIHGPKGVVMDTAVPPQCHASDEQLLTEGPAGCPAASKVGSGFAVTDSGGGGPGPRYSRATLSDFNTNGGVIGVGVSDDFPAIKTVDHTTFDRNRSTTNFPSLVETPPSEPILVLKSLHESYPPYARGGRPYARTPPTCPRVGYWTIKATFTYQDGVKQSVVSHSRCKRSAARRALRHGSKRHRDR